MKPNFSTNSPNFWASLITFILSIAALGGVNFGIDPTTLSQKLVTTLQGGSLWAVVGIVVTNLVTPIYYVIRNKAFHLSLRSSNFWIQAVTFLISVGVMYGIGFEQQAAAGLVEAIAAKDWALLVSIAIPAIINPLVRFLKDFIPKKPITAAATSRPILTAQ